MDEVEKITKEENLPVFKNRQRPALKGYKGFFDAGYLWDIRNSNTINANKLELSTSHGFQFNNHFYIGGGVALDTMMQSVQPYRYSQTSVPTFSIRNLLHFPMSDSDTPPEISPESMFLWQQGCVSR